LLRDSEGRAGASQISKIAVGSGKLLSPPEAPARLLEFVGDSITAGYGNLGTSANCEYSVETQSFEQTYGAVAGRFVTADVSAVAVSGRGVYRNFDKTTEGTMPLLFGQTLANDPAPQWKPVAAPDVVVVNLGTNDFVGDDPGADFDNAYERFAQELRESRPGSYLLFTVGPMLEGPALTHVRDTILAVALARRSQGDDRVGMLEFPREEPADLGCGYHPNAGKHHAMGEQLAGFLSQTLGW
ncbi:MAG TPA: SGNH/GDSL hydrolase family protein, partial [Polyangia bacterium]|nr:SGNH/GDSL hydrolase family protein [Polyangia bacterium]